MEMASVAITAFLEVGLKPFMFPPFLREAMTKKYWFMVP